jgi:hypothetical protein
MHNPPTSSECIACYPNNPVGIHKKKPLVNEQNVAKSGLLEIGFTENHNSDFLNHKTITTG